MKNNVKYSNKKRYKNENVLYYVSKIKSLSDIYHSNVSIIVIHVQIFV